MAGATVATFVETLRTLPLLAPDQAAQFSTLEKQFPDVKAIGQELIRRGWLTPFQANLIARGKGHELVLDQYVLLDLLGEGGMGSVFKARQQRMNRFVALKVIRREAMKSPGAVERFQREARVAAKLSHANVVSVFDSNEVKGIHFLVMEYIEGSDLAAVLRKQGVPSVGEACEYIRQAALGLQHAHEQGLVHRDIKPHNLMLTNKGVIKVMDLGLARTVSGADAAASEGLTGTGATMGTADYMAPEQGMNAKGVDIRADIYSLGCTLYQLLAGQLPFPGTTMTEKLIGHQLHEPDPVEKERPEVPKALARVVRKMMAKKPDKRYQTPAEVAEALAPFAAVSLPAQASASASRPAPLAAVAMEETLAGQVARSSAATVALRPGRKRRRVAIVCGLVAAVLLVALVFAVLPSRAPDRGQQARGPADNQTPAGKTGPSRVPEVRQTASKPAQPDTRPSVDPVRLPLVVGSFVRLPKGTFYMGWDGTKKGVKTEIKEDFEIAAHAVTQGQWQAVMDKNPSWFSRDGQGKDKVKDIKDEDLKQFPVETVSWDDCQEFIKKLNEKEQGRGYVYRLPTEAEWEYACRGGATSEEECSYHFYFDKPTNDLSSKQANFNGNSPFGKGDKGPNLERTTKVGSYAPNKLGLYDMHGNVWQWCEDLYDPKGSGRVRRGGSWYNDGDRCLAASRSGIAPTDRHFDLGVRLARVPRPVPGKFGSFVRLPKGTFYMGWDGTKKGVKTEIKEDFEIAAHAVTQGQWQAVMDKNPSWFSRDGQGKDKVKDIKDEDLKQFPVETVSWDDCQEFIKKLNEKEQGRGYVYRLPTEAEWEYACRGGATSEEECSYHFYFDKPTNDLSSKQANFNGNSPFGKGDKGPNLERTTKVGSYAPNKLGLYDMHGNVWQWCEDLYDPKGSGRVGRGGGWNGFGGICRAAIRNGFAPTDRDYYLGVRLARVPRPVPGK